MRPQTQRVGLLQCPKLHLRFRPLQHPVQALGDNLDLRGMMLRLILPPERAIQVLEDNRDLRRTTHLLNRHMEWIVQAPDDN